ncbi:MULTISPECIES: ArsR/SmtB family transcription factor [unclassified Streptomyces]|uniref:ArsR/SmtB family transcription factor n=1 Tax=unclassified Streptomyces TaxID=2593676 RepID=UPI002E27EF10|nr:metalloregulator ArsR/SmtB family transcription factor [Streptomyces sp. NBC_00223]
MRQIANPGVSVSDVMKALSDPIRWDIIRQMAEVPELPCAVLESTLPISKPTISYHTKILGQVGLLEVRKEGRNFFYTLNREVLRDLMDELWALAPEPRPVKQGRVEHRSPSRRRYSRQDEHTQQEAAASGQQNDLVLLTW